MKKTIYLASVFCGLIFIISNSALAISNYTSYWSNSSRATPTVFEVKPINMKFCESFDLSTGACNGANDYTMTKTYTANDGWCDIAAASTGTIACEFGPTSGMTVGTTYNYVWMELDRTFRMTGVVANSDSDINYDYCATSSSNVNTDGTPNLGSNSATASKQSIYFINGVGNNTTGSIYNNSSTTGSTIMSCDTETGDRCVFNEHEELKAAGYETPTNYTYSTDYGCTWCESAGGASDKIWQSELTSSDTSFTMIYKITPYTSKSGINPIVEMSFGVANGLEAEFSKFTNREESPAVVTDSCTLSVGNPTVTITVSDS
ncbi:hypothetical protein OAD12_01845 [Pelagibacterales bacterium]|nr:hypothetical protein [Pelagibacterales bacterium]